MLVRDRIVIAVRGHSGSVVISEIYPWPILHVVLGYSIADLACLGL